MLKLFEYNWQVREDWFNWCESLTEDELLKRRTGGPGSILYTMFHIVECEYSWLTALQGKPMPDEPPFENYAALHKIRDYSAGCHEEIVPFIRAWDDSMEFRILATPDGQASFKYGEVMRHVIAHEIHHIGQLSVWSRELGKQPVSANLIYRGLFDQ